MSENEIMTELRAVREEYAKSFDYDLEAIFRDAQAKQLERTDREVVHLEPKQVAPADVPKSRRSA